MKNRVKKLFACITVLIILCLAASACADMLEDIRAKGKIKVGVEAKAKPFVFWNIDKDTEKQSLEGSDIELAKSVAEEIGVDVEFSDQAFSGLLTALTVGEVDIVCSGMVARDERKEVTDFSDPYYISRDILITRAEDGAAVKAPDDLAGKKIGVVLGSIQMQVLEKQFPDAEEVLLESSPMLYMELVSGGVDAIIEPILSYRNYMTQYADRIAVSDIEIDSTDNPVAVAVRKGDNASLLEIINKVIADYLKKDKYNKILDKWTELGTV